MSFLSNLREYEDLAIMQGSTEKDIENAEELLGVKFSEDYKEYTLAVGAACVNGHEITGVVDSKRMNVVEATNEARGRIGHTLPNLYLLENTGIDKILVWQDEKGDLYQTIGNSEPQKMGKTLTEYISL